jgi:hypothetical protein
MHSFYTSSVKMQEYFQKPMFSISSLFLFTKSVLEYQPHNRTGENNKEKFVMFESFATVQNRR